MGFSFTTVEPNQIGRVTKFDIPLNEWVGLKFGAGFTDTLGNQIYQWSEDRIDHNPAKPEVLNRAFGIEGHLKFDEPTSIQRARLMHERKRKELERAAYFESASHSWFSGKAAVGFGAAMIGGLSNPVDLGLSFLPFIGSEKAAAQVAKIGGGSFRQALARGVIAEESLAGKIPMHRLTASVIDGTVNQAAMEIPIAIQKYRDQADYNASDFAFNVAAGGAFAGAIKGLGLALERAGKLWMEMDPRMKEAKLNETLRSIITGETPRTEFAGMDEAAIRAKVEEKIRNENPFVSPESGTTRYYRGEGNNFEGTGKSGQFWTIDLETAKRYAGENGEVFFVDVSPGEFVSDAADGVIGRDFVLSEETIVRRSPLKQGIDTALETIAQKEARGIELTPEESAKVESLIDPETPDAYNAYQRRVAELEESLGKNESIQAERKAATESFLEKAKAEHEAKLKGMIDVETRKVINDIRASSPVVSTDTVKKYLFKNIPDDANIKAVEDDFAQLSDDVMAIAKTEDEMAALEAEIKAGLKDLEETGLSGEKAIDEMIPCATSRAKI